MEPEDDIDMFDRIYEDTLARARERNPELADKVVAHFQDKEERLQWLQNVIDGYY